MDIQHPIDFDNILLSNVDSSSKVWIHPTYTSKIGQQPRCGQIECDGLKKSILTDKDGSFLGEPGTVISQSLKSDDIEIPKEARLDDSGHLKNLSDVYKETGIIRDEHLCSFVASWNAWHCKQMSMKLLIIESMDEDTESRRLSPLTIISDDNKYADFVNGPECKL